ncbi:MAG: hypothetical protein EOO30_00135 [Comamonadaceae bacterium]|nr:MAG: hypothetical protein EOO30_00135 [Comamonadaceae bacterium]
MTTATGHVPVPASILSLRMRASGGNARQQEARHQRLLEIARKALAGWPDDCRVVLEAPEGLAFVGDIPPSVALQAAEIASQDGADAPLGIALHHGPVQVVRDGGTTRVTGEGIETATALAAFTSTEGIVASQAFRDRIAAVSPRTAEDLRPAGEMVDDQLRKHPIFVFDGDASRGRATRRTVVAGSGLVLLLGAGWAARVAREQYEAARRPAIIHLDIKPAGEIFIDGKLHGATPPLREVQVPPGVHTIEVRSGRFPPLRLEVDLQPAEELQLRHMFAAPPAPPRRSRPPRREEPPPLIEQLKDRIRRLL